MYVQIGGIEQWIQCSDPKPDNPVLLYLHGGPGGTSVPAAGAWRAWEEHFTVVHWDQRGAGRTFAKNGDAGCGRLTIDRMVKDAAEVSGYLAETLGKQKILLVGHSWGSALGIFLLKCDPERFCGFVGTGQIVNMRENEAANYRREILRAEQVGNAEALAALRAIGTPPYSDRGALKVLREWADRLAEGDGDAVQPRPTPPAPDFRPEEVPMMLKGAEFSRSQLFEEIGMIDLPSLGLTFDVPMFFFHGTCDQQTPLELAERYCNSIVAPHKEFVRFDGCHHFVVMNRPDAFLQQLIARVRPHILS
jgi:pimeloyl-ACP methyl ester carboxylesterase